MSALENTTQTTNSPVLLRPVVDSRPPAYRFGEAGRIDLDDDEPVARQPTLLDALREMADEGLGPPRPRGVRILTDRVPGALEPAPGLPEPGGWTAVLGLAIGQALVGARPVGQLDHWLEPGVLADLKRTVREQRLARVRPGQGPARGAPVRVVSVRVQLPTRRAVEAAIHLRIGGQSSALAVRLTAYGQRWVCTALARAAEPGPESVSDLRPARDTA